MKMLAHATAWLMALWCVGGNVSAQVYKSVGPDGKITYSDQPSDDRKAAVTVLEGTGRPRPMPAPAEPQSGATPPETNPERKLTQAAGRDATGPGSGGGRSPIPLPTERQPHAKPALTPGGAHNPLAAALPGTRPQAQPPMPPPGDARPAPDPATLDRLEKAARVLGVRALHTQARDQCIRTLPTSFKRYDDAYTEWERRNQAVLAKAERITSSHLNEQGRARVLSAAEGEAGKLLSKVFSPSVATAHRIAWCDQTAKEQIQGKSDVTDRMGPGPAGGL